MSFIDLAQTSASSSSPAPRSMSSPVSTGRVGTSSCSPPISPSGPRGRVRASRCRDPPQSRLLCRTPAEFSFEPAYGLLNCGRRGNWSSTSGNGRELRVRKRRLPVRVPERDPARHAARSTPAPQLRGRHVPRKRGLHLGQSIQLDTARIVEGRRRLTPPLWALRSVFIERPASECIPANMRPKPSSTIFEEGHRGEPE